MGIEVERLGPGDAAAYQAIRREMLADSPWSFLASPGDDSAEDTGQLERRLRDPENVILAVRSGEGLAAVAGVRRIERMKMRHWASVWGVYTSPAYRRRGYSRALLEGAIALARTWGGVEMIGIAASANAPEAIGLYESVGFVAWGREPNVTRVGQNTYDEIHLAMSL